jgi:Asp-tRNA(Asn)/Glu-tRNA(Gln) amidotransferase A subunit family amidase
MALENRHVFWANYYGLPAVSLPCGMDSTGHPFSIQIVGKHKHDVQVLMRALELESAQGIVDADCKE